MQHEKHNHESFQNFWAHSVHRKAVFTDDDQKTVTDLYEAGVGT